MLNCFSSQETCPITEASGTNPSLTSHTKLTVTFLCLTQPSEELATCRKPFSVVWAVSDNRQLTVRCKNLVPCCLEQVTCCCCKHRASTAYVPRSFRSVEQRTDMCERGRMTTKGDGGRDWKRSAFRTEDDAQNASAVFVLR